MYEVQFGGDAAPWDRDVSDLRNTHLHSNLVALGQNIWAGARLTL